MMSLRPPHSATRAAPPLALAAILLCASAHAQRAAAPDEQTAITIYSTATPGAVPPELYRPTRGDQPSIYPPRQVPGFAVVKHERRIALGEGRGEVRFQDVAALIDPTTVIFTSLTDPEGTQVVEQNFQFDLVSTQKLLERYIDHPITVDHVLGDQVERVAGILLSTSRGLILRTPPDAGGDVRLLNSYANIRFPELPEGLITRPTLVWDIFSSTPGPHTARVSYETQGATWWADYNIVFTDGQDANTALLDVNAWVSILNQSGATYPNARLKLIAGDVHRAPQPAHVRFDVDRRAHAAEAAPAGFEERAFFEYHLYTLQRPTTLPDNSTKQLELFEAARGVPAERLLVYEGLPPGFGGFRGGGPMTDRGFGSSEGNTKVDTYLRFRNTRENGLGIPLPSGRIRVSRLDEKDDSLEFIGEDVIDHTPRGEEVLVRLGSAFDLVGERTQTDFTIDTNRRWMEESIRIKVRNHKEEPVNIVVRERLYRWTNWEITQATREFEKIDARTIHFPIRVDPGGEAVVAYKVRYTW